MKTVGNYSCTVYAGFRSSKRVHSLEDALAVVQEFADASEGTPGGCVTVTPTTFVYVRGSEPGVAVGFINYPRFPSSEAAVVAKAIELGRLLKKRLQQKRVSIVTPTKTIMV